MCVTLNLRKLYVKRQTPTLSCAFVHFLTKKEIFIAHQHFFAVKQKDKKPFMCFAAFV